MQKKANLNKKPVAVLRHFLAQRRQPAACRRARFGSFRFIIIYMLFILVCCFKAVRKKQNNKQQPLSKLATKLKEAKRWKYKREKNQQCKCSPAGGEAPAAVFFT